MFALLSIFEKKNDFVCNFNENIPRSTHLFQLYDHK